jgi:hypothetical protein
VENVFNSVAVNAMKMKNVIFLLKSVVVAIEIMMAIASLIASITVNL